MAFYVKQEGIIACGEFEEESMAFCELTGKRPVVGNLVSHSNIKTKHWLQPNIQRKRLYSQSLKQMVTLKLATATLRSIEHHGGFDRFILNESPEKMSKRAQAIRQRILRKSQSKPQLTIEPPSPVQVQGEA